MGFFELPRAWKAHLVGEAKGRNVGVGSNPALASWLMGSQNTLGRCSYKQTSTIYWRYGHGEASRQGG